MEILNYSIQIKEDTVAGWPSMREDARPIDLGDIRTRFDGSFAVNNSMIGYVYEGEYYVTPYTREAMSRVVEAGLVRQNFYVPFSDGSLPINELMKWGVLKELAAESRTRDYEEDCQRWCEENGVARLSSDTMRRCFRMPKNGLPVRCTHYVVTYYPICNEAYLDCTVADALGHYNSNNGKVVFVYRDGHTYITRGYWIIPHLQHGGYRLASLFVPLSNGEEIIDSSLATEWRLACKKAHKSEVDK